MNLSFFLIYNNYFTEFRKFIFNINFFSISPCDQVSFLGRTKKSMSALSLKKGDLSIVSICRPISLLKSESYFFERLVFKYLFNHLQDNYLLSSPQSGFIPGDSTIKQMKFLYYTFCQALDSGEEVRAVFCDISKAFDRVWHSGL